MALKHQWSQALQQPLSQTYQLEQLMHQKTFVDQQQTLDQIESLFSKPEVSAPVTIAAEPVAVAAVLELGSVIASLRGLLAQELRIDEDEVEDNTQFVDLGLDSISGVTWMRKINDLYQTNIDATKVYSYPTLAQMSRYVTDLAQPVDSSPSKPTQASKAPEQKVVETAAPVRQSQPIAVIGMAGQFPGANDVDEFWQNIAAGKNSITEINPLRWDIEQFYQSGAAAAGKTNSKWLGQLQEIDLFDPLFFNISPREAKNMDPQQRLFLQESWHTIENAGYQPHSLSGVKCGVFVGCAGGDYHQRSEQHRLSAQGFTGAAASILAARISYHLNLTGPCISIDTACSSSLVAIANACDSLNAGDSDLALAGGVNVLTRPSMHIMCSQTGMLSTDGKCYSFDHRANGFVPGEGVGVIMLKRLSDAQDDNDNILGLIEGWGINQDGKTNGITAPNPESQAALQQAVYDKYQIDPAQIQLVETHGTGTKLGDPIEIDGLKTSFGQYTNNTGYCALGSVKSNIGHGLTAAGISGVIKLLQAIKHQQLPPTIHFEKLNEHIGLSDSPFYINDQLQPWTVDDNQQRRAAISSFGFSGTNAHMVIAQYQAPEQSKPPRLSLPAYPFAKKRFWIEADSVKPALATPALHPLLHSNTSDLNQQRYSSTFKDERLTAGAYLEMARAAVVLASGTNTSERPQGTVLELRNTVWGEPMAANGTVHIALFSGANQTVDFEAYSDNSSDSNNENEAEDVVHYQGHGVFVSPTNPATIDLTGLKPIQLKNDDQSNEYVLHPMMINQAIKAASINVREQSTQPYSLDVLRVLRPCAKQMFGVIRQNGAKLDIDICDCYGNVSVQMLGLAFKPVATRKPPTAKVQTSPHSFVQSSTVEPMMAVPNWLPTPVTAENKMNEYQRHVVLCELQNIDSGEVEALIPGCHCLT